MHIPIILAAAVALSSVGYAQHSGHPQGQSYSGYASREIKALSPAQIEDLRTGRGMGLALPAELNGYPGPLHVLELEHFPISLHRILLRRSSFCTRWAGRDR